MENIELLTEKKKKEEGNENTENSVTTTTTNLENGVEVDWKGSEITEGDTLTPSEEVETVSEESGATETKPEDGLFEIKEAAVQGSENGVAEKGKNSVEKMFTQSQVNEMVGKARQEGRDAGLKNLLLRYGVDKEDELDEIFGKGQTYDDLNDDYSTQGNSFKQVVAENALLKSHIDETRWDDVKLILGGKGLEVTAENIEAFIPSHPEWKKTETQVESQGKTISPEQAEQFAQNMGGEQKTEKPAILKKLGNEPSAKTEETESEQVKRLFGFDL